jgi:hypothetical protein
MFYNIKKVELPFLCIEQTRLKEFIVKKDKNIVSGLEFAGVKL